MNLIIAEKKSDGNIGKFFEVTHRREKCKWFNLFIGYWRHNHKNGGGKKGYEMPDPSSKTSESVRPKVKNN